MKRLLALLLCAVMLLSVTACKNKEDTPSASNTTGTTTTTTTEAESSSPRYAWDPLINRFFVDMVESGSIDPQSIHRSTGVSGMTEEELLRSYEATLNGQPITVRNASYEVGTGEDAYTVYQLRVSIEGGSDQKAQETLMKAFAVVASALGCSKTDIENATAVLNETTATVSDQRVNSNVKVLFYTPVINNPEMHVSVPCRIDIAAMDYRAAED